MPYSSSSPEFSVAFTVTLWVWDSSVLVEMQLEGGAVLLGQVLTLSKSREGWLPYCSVSISGHEGIT